VPETHTKTKNHRSQICTISFPRGCYLHLHLHSRVFSLFFLDWCTRERTAASGEKDRNRGGGCLVKLQNRHHVSPFSTAHLMIRSEIDQELACKTSERHAYIAFLSSACFPGDLVINECHVTMSSILSLKQHPF
jgi:hypothetical protein